MNLYNRHPALHSIRQSVGNGERVMRIGAGVDDHAAHLFVVAGCLQSVDDVAFAVMLTVKYFHIGKRVL